MAAISEKKIIEKVKHYRELTQKALSKISTKKGISENEKKMANAFLEMAKNYFSDAGYFDGKKDFLTALAAYSYAHAWLDAGIKAGLLDGKGDDRLFIIP